MNNEQIIFFHKRLGMIGITWLFSYEKKTLYLSQVKRFIDGL